MLYTCKAPTKPVGPATYFYVFRSIRSEVTHTLTQRFQTTRHSSCEVRISRSSCSNPRSANAHPSLWTAVRRARHARRGHCHAWLDGEFGPETPETTASGCSHDQHPTQKRLAEAETP